MKPHAILRRNCQDDTESNTEKQSDDGCIIVPAQIAGNDDPCPNPDGNENCGYHWTDYTGNDDFVSPARDILWKLGRHSAGKVRWVILMLEIGYVGRNKQVIGKSAMKERRRRTKDLVLPSQSWGGKFCPGESGW